MLDSAALPITRPPCPPLSQEDVSHLLVDDFRALAEARGRGQPQREFCRWAFPDVCPEVSGLGLFARSPLKPNQVNSSLCSLMLTPYCICTRSERIRV